jgi:PST family polysaccharide transporter
VTATSSNKRLLQNIVSITAFQASGYILAMINVPYLTRTLGVAEYGVLAFTISVNAYLFLLIDWGFSLGASREVARAKGDEKRIREIFWQTITAKGILSFLALAALAAVAALHHVPNVRYILLLPGALNIISAVLSVDWFVQGLQRMGLFTVCSICGRALVVGLTFFLVHGPENVSRACCLQVLGGLLASFAGFVIARRYLKMGQPMIPLRQAVGQIWDFRHYFLIQSSWIAYSTAPPLVLTIVSGSVAVGLFAGAERLIRIAMSLIFPLTTALYHHGNALVAESRDAAVAMGGLLLAGQTVFGLALFAVFLLGANPIVAIVLGSQFSASAEVLRCLAVLPLLTGIGGALSTQLLIPLGWRREVSSIVVRCTCVYLVSLVVLCHYAGALGAAIALILAETLITIGFVGLLLRHERQFALAAFRAALHAPSQIYLRWGELFRERRQSAGLLGRLGMFRSGTKADAAHRHHVPNQKSELTNAAAVLTMERPSFPTP